MKKLRITVGKKTYDVTVEVLEDDAPQAMRPQAARVAAPMAAPPPSSEPSPVAPKATGAVLSPMAGIVKSILVKPDDDVEKGTTLLILEAMKMENPITAPDAGSVKSVDVSAGQSVREGETLITLE